MEVSGQLHAALPPGKETPIYIGQEAKGRSKFHNKRYVYAVFILMSSYVFVTVEILE